MDHQNRSHLAGKVPVNRSSRPVGLLAKSPTYRDFCLAISCFLQTMEAHVSPFSISFSILYFSKTVFVFSFLLDSARRHFSTAFQIFKTIFKPFKYGKMFYFLFVGKSPTLAINVRVLRHKDKSRYES